jgi:hypothetical protein
MPIDWTSQLASWLPFIALILVWVFLSQRLRAGSSRQLSRMNEFYEVQLTEMQRLNVLLDRIAVALEKRAERPA